MSEQPFDIKNLVKQAGREVAPAPRWEKPPFEEEVGEVDRTADELGLDKELLRAAYQAGQLEQLSDEDWAVMENCDSRDREWTSAEVAGHLAATRDYATIEAGFKSGNRMYTPVVLFRPGQPPYLVAGNSRLLGCRALGIAPTILAMRFQ